MTWLLSWDDSPEAFNRWTTIRSARVFASRMLGSDSLVNYTAIDEQAALTALMQVEYDQANPNSLTGGPFSAPFPHLQRRHRPAPRHVWRCSNWLISSPMQSPT